MARTGILTGGNNTFQTTSEDLNKLRTNFFTDGPVGTIGNANGVAPMTGVWAVNAQGTPNMTVAVTGGDGHVTATPTSEGSQRLNVTIDAQNVTIAANSSGSTKYDWIYVKVDPALALNPDVNAATVSTIFTSRSSSNSTDNGTPPTYGYCIAVVTVANAAPSITNGNIQDKRTQAGVNALAATIPTSGWNTLPNIPVYGSNNGNKEFTVTYTGDLTSTVNVGDKVSIARGTTPPTQAMSFTAASSQYATKASPAGITFTSAFTTEAWIYLNSYQSGSQQIIGRYDGSNTGWVMYVSNSGQLGLGYGNGTARFISTYQSLPLKRWVHVGVSVSSVASGTATLYINGVAVPQQTSGTGTALTNTGNLQIGASNTPNIYFDGYISEARAWSAAQSQAQIQANMAISLTGSETNLVALFQGNGNFNDKTANGNNLTATNGAIATQAANPYNATEYGIITKASYSNPTTTLTIFTGTDYTIPNQTLGTASYSHQRSPFGFPAGREKWRVWSLYLTALDSSAASPFWTKGQLSVPAGEWMLWYQGGLRQTNSTGNAANCAFDLNTNATSSPAVGPLSTLRTNIYAVFTGATAYDVIQFVTSQIDSVSLTSQTVYNHFANSGISYNNMGIRGDFGPFEIVAECAYL